MKIQRYRGDEDRRSLSLRDAMNRLFNESFWDPMSVFNDSLPSLDSGSFAPSINVSENDKEYSIEANIAGYNPEQIKIKMNSNVLTLHGKKSEKKEEKDTIYHRREQSYGEFRREVILPPNAELGKIACKAKNGILSITVPKKPGEGEKKLIPIESE